VARSGKYFDISATKILDGGDVQTPIMFGCELQIPEAEYAVKKSIVYYPGKLIDEDSLNFVIRADLFLSSLYSMLFIACSIFNVHVILGFDHIAVLKLQILCINRLYVGFC
jgi:hypothetical protein